MEKIKMIRLKFTVEGKDKEWLVRPEDISMIKVFHDQVELRIKTPVGTIQPFGLMMPEYESQILPYLDIINEPAGDYDSLSGDDLEPEHTECKRPI